MQSKSCEAAEVKCFAIFFTLQNFKGMTSCPECAGPTEDNSASSQPAKQAKAETEPQAVHAIPEDPGPEPDPGPGMALLPLTASARAHVHRPTSEPMSLFCEANTSPPCSADWALLSDA